VLWAADNTGNHQGCGDTYGVSTNDSPTHLGLRENLPAFSGEFEQCGSMFAPGATPPGPCNQTNSGNTGDSFERRLVVEESELQTTDALYYFEGWYVIRDDINIFNTMAHKSVDPSFGSSWSFPATSGNTLGPAIDAWVPPGTMEAMQAHAVESTVAGHYSVAVKVTELEKGVYRYVYALMNYDFDPQFNSFTLSLPDGIVVNNIQYLDGDSSGANDWASSTAGNQLSWTAPNGAALEWGHMATFVFEANETPSPGPVALTAEEEMLEFSPFVLGPNPDLDFKEGFEN
jgi:hypothetical protein